MVRAWLADGGFSAEDMREARRRSLQPDKEQVAKTNALVEIVNARLAIFGRKRQVTPCDGNCQFIAVARGLGLADEAHLKLREDVVEYLISHRSEFEEFQAEGSWDRYIEDISTPNVGWGDYLTLIILTRLFYSEIQIVSDGPEPPYVQTITPPEIRKSGIVIVHYGEVHYESTVPI